MSPRDAPGPGHGPGPGLASADAPDPPTAASTTVPPGPPPRAAAPALWLLVAMTGLGPFSMQVLIPALPVLARDLGVSYASAQLSLTLYLVGVAAGQLLYGPLSDRRGRRPPLFAGLALYLAASVVAALAPSLGWLLAARVAQAVGACAGLVLARAIVRDVWPREEAASRLGYVTMGMTVAPMAAPLVGALLEERFGWRAALWSCLLFGAPLLLAAWARLPETLRPAERRGPPRPGAGGPFAALARDYAVLLRAPAFRAPAAVVACSTGVFFSFMAGAPRAVVEGLGLAPRTYALAFVAISVAFALGSWLAGRHSARLGVARMLSLGVWSSTAGAALGVGLAALPVLGLAPPTLAALFGPMTLIAVGNGASQPSAIAAAVGARPALAGTASGLMGAAQMTFGALMTLVAGLAETGSGLGMAITMLGCSIGAQLALRGTRRGLAPAAPPPPR